jgi:hypothetical protein
MGSNAASMAPSVNVSTIVSTGPAFTGTLPVLAAVRDAAVFPEGTLARGTFLLAAISFVVHNAIVRVNAPLALLDELLEHVHGGSPVKIEVSEYHLGGDLSTVNVTAVRVPADASSNSIME